MSPLLSALGVFVTVFSPSSGFATMKGTFALSARLALKPERRDEFLKVIQYDGQQTVATEPGALQFVLGEDTSAQNVFYLHEQYHTAEDLEVHEGMPHFAGWKEFVSSDPFTEAPVVEKFTCTHEPVQIPIRHAFCLNVELCVKPESRDDFLRVIENNYKGSNQEQLCLQYNYGESVETPNTFHFHEEYTGEEEGKEGFDAHAKAPHFKVWEEFADTDPFTKPPVVQFFKSIV